MHEKCTDNERGRKKRKKIRIDEADHHQLTAVEVFDGGGGVKNIVTTKTKKPETSSFKSNRRDRKSQSFNQLGGSTHRSSTNKSGVDKAMFVENKPNPTISSKGKLADDKSELSLTVE